MSEISDEELVARFRAAGGSPGGNSHLDLLFQRHYQRVSWWCVRFTGDREAALDLAQEVFALAYRHIDSFQGQAKFSTWLYTIARNRCINEAKSRARRAEEPLEPVEFELEDSQAGSVLDDLARKQEIGRFRGAVLKHLDETERNVLTLHYVQELPLSAINRLLALTNKSGAKAYIVSARRKLEQVLRRDSPGAK